MRACTATTLSARYRDPVIRPSIDSMIFRNDFGKKTTSTDNANHPRGTALFLRPWDTTLRDSSIAGNKALRDSWFPRVPFTPRSLSLSFSSCLPLFLCSLESRFSGQSRPVFEYRPPFSHPFLAARFQRIAVSGTMVADLERNAEL